MLEGGLGVSEAVGSNKQLEGGPPTQVFGLPLHVTRGVALASRLGGKERSDEAHRRKRAGGTSSSAGIAPAMMV